MVVGLAAALGLALLGLMLKPSSARPTLVIFTSRDAPLAAALGETLAAAPVQQLVQAHFSRRRVDSRAEEALFRRWVGGSGLLASAVVDDAVDPPDVVAVLPGYADVERYCTFLDQVARQLPRLRELRGKSRESAAANLELAELYAQQGSLARARSCLESIQAPIALHMQALEHLARLDAEVGRTALARAELERAGALGPNGRSERWLLTEALILSSERRVSEAAQSLRRGLPSLQPGTERARGFLLLGQLEHELHRDVEALAAVAAARAEARDPRIVRAATEQIQHLEHPEPGHQH